MSQNLIDAIHIISASSTDALEVNSESPADDMFVHTLTSYARAKRESLNALRVVASMGKATTEEEVRRDFECLPVRESRQAFTLRNTFGLGFWKEGRQHDPRWFLWKKQDSRAFGTGRQKYREFSTPNSGATPSDRDFVG